jgi:hypothetical protein
VCANLELIPFCGGENSDRILLAEGAPVAEDIDELRKLAPRGLGNHLFADQVDIFLWIIFELIGNYVRAE